MGAPTKYVYVALTLRVPKWMTKMQAAREVRTLVNEQRNYMSHGADYEEVIVKASHVKAISLGDRRTSPPSHGGDGSG